MKKKIIIALSLIIIILELMPKSIKLIYSVDNNGVKEYIYNYSSHFAIYTFASGLYFPIILAFMSVFLLVILILSYYINIKDETVNTTLIGMFIFSLSPLIMGFKALTVFNVIITILIVLIFILNNYQGINKGQTN